MNDESLDQRYNVSEIVKPESASSSFIVYNSTFPSLLHHFAEPNIMKKAGEIIRAGGLVGFPTETVYGLAADAFNVAAVERVYEVKGRPAGKPLPVQIASIPDAIRLTSDLSDSALRLMEAFFPGPLTVIVPASAEIPALVTAGTGKIGIRMPDHHVALALIREAGTPIVAPSANISDHPAPTTAQSVIEYFDGKIDMVLDAGPTLLRVASTVIDLTQSPARILRQGAITREMLSEYVSVRL
jgi:L-threonylcarbamoyladenylate synthase